MDSEPNQNSDLTLSPPIMINEINKNIFVGFLDGTLLQMDGQGNLLKSFRFTTAPNSTMPPAVSTTVNSPNLYAMTSFAGGVLIGNVAMKRQYFQPTSTLSERWTSDYLNSFAQSPATGIVYCAWSDGIIMQYTSKSFDAVLPNPFYSIDVRTYFNNDELYPEKIQISSYGQVYISIRSADFENPEVWDSHGIYRLNSKQQLERVAPGEEFAVTPMGIASVEAFKGVIHIPGSSATIKVPATGDFPFPSLSYGNGYIIYSRAHYFVVYHLKTKKLKSFTDDSLFLIGNGNDRVLAIKGSKLLSKAETNQLLPSSNVFSYA